MSEIDRQVAKKFRLNEGLRSPEPQVKLESWTQVPPQEGMSEEERLLISHPNIIAGKAAQTCYSAKLHEPQDYYLQSERQRQITDDVVVSTRESGHLTTRQHVYFNFGIVGISRQALWSFLHSHPYYNSEQQSQRYVEMKPGYYLVPDLEGDDLELYQQTVAFQMEAYQQLDQMLFPVAEGQYYSIFKNRVKQKDEWQKTIKSKCQEVARYVLPTATHANLWHTISPLVLMRLARMCEQYDVPLETKLVVSKMVGEVAAKTGVSYLEEISDPIPLEETPEFQNFKMLGGEIDLNRAKRLTGNFDRKLNGRVSKLVGYTTNAPEILADTVRNVSGDDSVWDDREAIERLMNPAKNKLLGEPLNVTTVDKISRSMDVVSYTFAKKLSHTADSQDQRHRMTPAARPVLSAHYTGEPDFITPALIKATPAADRLYQEVIVKTFEVVNQLLARGVPFEKAAYLLPNALSIRFYEQGDLLNLHHKYRMRLCYTAQEEIWNASRDEVWQIEETHPEIGKWLLPPCTIRKAAGSRPYCLEGKKRICGVPVWNLAKSQYSRVI